VTGIDITHLSMICLGAKIAAARLEPYARWTVWLAAGIACQRIGIK
jgi:hypothetical protein